jgi:hypothetical protein
LKQRKKVLSVQNLYFGTSVADEGRWSLFFVAYNAEESNESEPYILIDNLLFNIYGRYSRIVRGGTTRSHMGPGASG